MKKAAFFLFLIMTASFGFSGTAVSQDYPDTVKDWDLRRVNRILLRMMNGIQYRNPYWVYMYLYRDPEEFYYLQIKMFFSYS